MSDRLDDIKYWSVINEQTIHPKVSLYKSDFDWLIEKVERYEKALKFYANKENYKEWNEDLGLTEYIHNVDFEGGDIAKKALEE
jgi:hypothetical protein